MYLCQGGPLGELVQWSDIISSFDELTRMHMQ